MRCETVTVLTNEEIAKDVYRLSFPFTHNLPKAGQFVMLQQEHATTLLARPISICNVTDKVMELVYQVIGKATAQMVSIRPGDSLSVTGPIGHGFPVDSAQGKIALVGGGVGVAPLLYTAKRLAEKNIAVDIHLGFRDEVYLIDEFAAFTSNLSVFTETGSFGKKGLVTAGFHPKEYDAVYCCGPTPMMQAVLAMCAECDVPIYVSLETKMACGIGACRVCTCTTVEGTNLRTCLDGPVFLGEELNFHA